jgi:hypothetical protein
MAILSSGLQKYLRTSSVSPENCARTGSGYREGSMFSKKMFRKMIAKRILSGAVCIVLLAGAALVLRAQEGDITNARVVEMTKIGLDDDIIIAKIKGGKCSFQLADSDLMDLKKAGVSSKVVAAMLDASQLTSTRVTIDQKDVTVHTLGEAKTGGRLGSALTYGIKSVKEKAYLEGPHSKIIVSPSPAIFLELPKDDTIDNYILVKMDPKSDRREIEVASAGGVVGSKSGIRAEAIQKTASKSLGGNKYSLSPTDTLKTGEYMIYVNGSADKIKGTYGRGYDFTVE